MATAQIPVQPGRDASDDPPVGAEVAAASEDRLRLTLESALLGTIEWDVVGGRGQWSRRACEIFGVDQPDEMAPRQLLQRLHPDDRARISSAIRRAIARDRQCAAEFRILLPDGDVRWVTLRARIERDAEDRPVEASVLLFDSTDRKLAEERLRESEARLRAIVEATPECVKIVDEDGCVRYMNPAGLALLEAEEFGEFCIPDLITPECRDEWLANHARVCAGENVSWEFEVVSMKGLRRRMETHAVPLRLADGRIQHLAVTRDVTQRRLSEGRLRESEGLLAAYMKNAPVGMYLKDSEGRYLLLNPEMSKVFGRPAEELIGRTAADLLGAEEAALVADFDREILESGRPSAVEEYLPGIDSYSWSLVVRFPIASDGDQPPRIGGFDIDITDRKNAEEALERSRDALHQSEKLNALGSLLAGVSHELNNPLAIVVTLSSLLEEEAAGTAMADRAAKIRKAGERCARIVQTFLAMARQRPPERRRVEANDIVRGALELAGYSLSAADIEVVEELAPDLPPLSADADQLHQMVLNLIVNAQQALQEKASGRRLLVRTAAADRGRAVTIGVRDNGPGVPQSLRRRVFEPFFTTKPVGEGTGLGLSFSLGVVEAHGGSLSLCEAPGGGACFLATLPAAEAFELPAARADSVRGDRRARVLVVDDDRDVAEALAELLEREGLCVDSAASAREAQKLIARVSYDIVLSDLRMPDIDGQVLFDWIKRLRPALAERTAFVTGDTMSSDAARISVATGRPLLEKPFRAEDVRRIIDQLIPTHAAGRQK
jgi:two-component system NtrC family sensor kinase